MPELTKEQKELRQLATECMEEALQKLLEGNLKMAEEICARARDIYEEIDDKYNLAAALNRLSVIYDEMGNESLDIECLMNAIEIAAGGDDYALEAKLFNNLGSKYMNFKAYDRALKYFRIASESFEKGIRENPDLEEYSFRLVLNLNFCTIYYYKGELEHARHHYLLAKEAAGYPIDSDLYFVFKCFEGLTLWRLGEKEKVYELIESIYSSAKETEYTTDYLEVMTDFLELLKEMRDYERWESILSLMESRLDKDVSLVVRVEILKRWIEFYKESGNNEMYIQSCIKYYELTKLKEKEDYLKSADAIELQERMRHAAKQKKHADEIVYLDPLTGIGNRNRMLEDSRLYIERSIKNVTPITLGLIDIDYFKECNDTYGHIVGDNCLKRVARVIEEAVGDYGNVYRYGGDEFLLLLPKIEEKDIEKLGQNIKNRLADEMIPNMKSPISAFVTVSQGYTCACAEEGDSIETLVTLVDRVLYTVKRRGRNNYIYADFDDVLQEL